ncbi:MAG: hypothetical protein Q8Q09_24255 [Deltaproteobacteria bacterium]|nr:hypothetical protein [Deltaproteobacteria bacterium]
MRYPFATLAALIVAIAVTLVSSSANASSAQQSMPRTFAAPPGMGRCLDVPMSLALDIAEREAARFATPESLTSHGALDPREIRSELPRDSRRGARQAAQIVRYLRSEQRSGQRRVVHCATSQELGQMPSVIQTHPQDVPPAADESVGPKTLWSGATALALSPVSNKTELLLKPCVYGAVALCGPREGHIALHFRPPTHA